MAPTPLMSFMNDYGPECQWAAAMVPSVLPLALSLYHSGILRLPPRLPPMTTPPPHEYTRRLSRAANAQVAAYPAPHNVLPYNPLPVCPHTGDGFHLLRSIASDCYRHCQGAAVQGENDDYLPRHHRRFRSLRPPPIDRDHVVCQSCLQWRRIWCAYS